jgi:hypothetical protein
MTFRKIPPRFITWQKFPSTGVIKEDLKILLSNSLRESREPRELGGGDLFDRYEYLGNMIGAATKKVVSKAAAKRQPAK